MEVSLHNQPSEIPLVHQALDELAARRALPARPIARLHLALEEHLTNIISHGYKPDQTGTITVHFALEASALRVEIEDDALPFNPAEAPAVDTSLPLEKKPVGGLGVHIIRKSVDELEYRCAGRRQRAGDDPTSLTHVPACFCLRFVCFFRMAFALTAYIKAALELARYDELEVGSFAVEIPKLQGLIVWPASLSQRVIRG